MLGTLCIYLCLFICYGFILFQLLKKTLVSAFTFFERDLVFLFHSLCEIRCLFPELVSGFLPALGGKEDSGYYTDKPADEKALQPVTVFIFGHRYTSLFIFGASGLLFNRRGNHNPIAAARLRLSAPSCPVRCRT